MPITINTDGISDEQKKTEKFKRAYQEMYADNPHANRLMIHLLAAFAEHEREAISTRTKAALEAARACGTPLGNRRWQESIEAARKAKALVPPAPAVMEMMQELRDKGLTLRAIADRLNALGLRTPKGSNWYASTVRGALELHGPSVAA